MTSHCALCHHVLPHNGWHHESVEQYDNGDRVCDLPCQIAYEIQDLADGERARMQKLIAAIGTVAAESDGMLMTLLRMLERVEVAVPAELGGVANQWASEMEELGVTGTELTMAAAMGGVQ